MDINSIIPDSLNDFAAIWFWVIEIILVIVAINLYLYYREIFKQSAKMRENHNTNHNTINQMKKSEEERLKEIVEIRNKVDKIIEEGKNKL